MNDPNVPPDKSQPQGFFLVDEATTLSKEDFGKLAKFTKVYIRSGIIQPRLNDASNAKSPDSSS